MTGLTFVNLRGESVSVAPIKAPTRPPPLRDAFHKGWQVVGFSPDHLAEAKRMHAADPARKIDNKLFDEVAFMRTSKPRKVRSKAYEVYAAALDCADLARTAGWKSVSTPLQAKGGAA